MFEVKFTDEEILEIAKVYIMEESCTLRKLSERFSIPKSTLHSAFRKRLKFIDEEVYDVVKEKLEFNAKVAPFRGGESTKRKWKYFHEKVRQSVS